ncbi:MAG: helicase C-terminal domain-containing protein [Candidatus Nanohaloarchaea archaeon]
MLGDGGIFGKRETIAMTTADESIENFFKRTMESFDSSVREVNGDEYTYKSSNRSLAWLLSELGLPTQRKEDLEIPDCVLTSRENLAAFISGLLDTDGSVDNQGKVELSTKSKKLADQLLVVFPVFGIRPTRNEKEVEGKTYQRIFISNQEYLEKLKERIGFRLERKQERLESALGKEHNPNKDIIPEMENLIKKAREKSGVEYSRKTVRRRLESYETGARRPSREGLREVIEKLDFEKNPQTQKLEKLIHSDIFWDKIESIEESGKETVYDLNVPENHNFSANNLVLHNTAATLTPAIEYALENNKKVFFLTPRHSQHQIAVETVKKMQDRHDVELTVIDLLGKKWLCNVEGVEEMTSSDFKDYCQTLRDEERCDFYTAMYDMDEHKLKDEAKDKLNEMEGEPMHSQEFKQSTPNFCPYYMMMELARRSDLIIADYFHIFHPGVRESIFERAGTQLEDTILIVDEAHNLPSRTRSLFSTSLSIPQIDRAITEAEKFGFYETEEKLEQLENILKQIAAEKFESGSHEEKIQKKDLKEPVSNIRDYGEFVVDLETIASEVRDEKERSYCGGIAEFLSDWDGDDEGYFRCIKRERSASGNRYIKLKYSCLDPQVSTKKALNECHSSILMSGTLTPQSMYVDLLGLETSTMTSAFKSPFPEENELNLLVETVTTKYSERDESMYQKYAWYLAKSFEKVPGNCAVFFPSYSLMKTIKQEIESHTDRKIFLERQGMNKEEKQELLEDFASRKNENDAVLFGVAAGSFGEGVDYPGEIIKAVFIVGLPLKRPDLETKSLINFYDYKFGKGWDYGYSYPAVNRAMQAAGRCIRSKDDEGVIVYMDERYDWSNYRKVFPPGRKLEKTKAPWKEIEQFF